MNYKEIFNIVLSHKRSIICLVPNKTRHGWASANEETGRQQSRREIQSDFGGRLTPQVLEQPEARCCHRSSSKESPGVKYSIVK